MRLLFTGQSPIPRAGALLVALAWLGYAPSVLGAGCARHYLGSAGGTSLFDATASLQSSALGFGSTSNSLPDNPVPPAPKCKGAFCSGGTPAGMPSIPSISVGSEEAWGGRGLGFAPVASRAFAFRAEERPAISQPALARVFHPPRLVSL